MSISRTEALVVGAGPTGLAMASELIRHGVDVRIIDQQEGPSQLSKAVVVMPRTLEEFELRGLADQTVAHGQPVHNFSIYAEGRMILETNFDHLNTKYRFLLSVPQEKTEKILTSHLENLGAKVEWGIEFVDFTQNDEMVRATIRWPDGSLETIETRWLLGCGGAHSKSRKMLGIPFRGAQYRDEWALGDVVIEWDYPHDRTAAFFTRRGYVAVFPMPEGRHRIYAAKAVRDGKTPTIKDLQSMMDRSCFVKSTIKDARWLSCFNIQHRKAPTYFKGRVFLAGDAAHIHSPESGLGMNTGIQDAFNLAWKIGLFHRGKVPRSTLDTYHAERSAVGKQVVRASDTMHKAWAVFDPRVQRVRDRIFQLASEYYRIYQRSIDKQSQLSIHYGHSPIVDGHVNKLDVRIVHTGPSEGSHAPDGELIVTDPIPGRGKPVRLFQLLQGTCHTLLLFSGSPARDLDIRLMLAAKKTVENYANLIKTVLITCEQDRMQQLLSASNIYLDITMKLHKTYGAHQCAAYLIRPDGYIGYRGRPISPEKLKSFLNKVFTC